MTYSLAVWLATSVAVTACNEWPEAVGELDRDCVFRVVLTLRHSVDHDRHGSERVHVTCQQGAVMGTLSDCIVVKWH